MSDDPRAGHWRLVLDLQACQSEVSRSRGIGRYSRGLATALLRDPERFCISIALNEVFPEPADALAREFSELISADRIVRYHAPAPRGLWDPGESDIARLAGERIACQAWTAEKPDLIHVSSLFEGLGGSAVVPSLLDVPEATVLSATAYDVIPLMMADTYLTDTRTRRWYQSRVDRMRRCDVLLAISEATRRDIISYTGMAGERVVNVAGAVDEKFHAADVSEERRAQLLRGHGLTKPYVMYTGGIEPRKNVEALIRAFGLLPAELRNAHQLAIVCSVHDADRARLGELARRNKLQSDAVVLTGYVADADLVDLYRCCDLFVFPSQYEGFGLPVLEAISCGAATIAANTSSIPEIVGRADALFELDSDETIARAITHALSDAGFRESLRRGGLEQASRFSWKNTAARAQAAWYEAIDRKAQSIACGVRSRRPRLALITPLHPERSGIADFTTEWLPHLARRFEIDLFCTPPADSDRYRELGYTVHSWEALPGCWLDYDAGLLYQMGNSEFHVHMLALLSICPGTVLLHDAYLSGLVAYCEFGPPRIAGLFSDMLAYCHPGVEYVAAERETLIERHSMSRWVADRALGVVVTSHHALTTLREQAQVDRARCAVVPHHRALRTVSKDERIAARQRLGISEDQFLVCTFGRVAERKLCVELLDAWSMAPRPSQSRLVYVGEADGDYGTRLRAQVRKAPDVAITGYVDDATFHAYMKAADLVVQLRTDSRGEASGAALYALAYGIPLVATRHGSLAEIDPHACVHADLPLDTAALAKLLTDLQADAPRRRALGDRAKAWIVATADPQAAADRLANHVLQFNDRRFAVPDERLGTWLEQLGPALLRTGDVRPVDIRRRAARSLSPRVTGESAGNIRRKLESLLPRYGAGQAPEPQVAPSGWRSIVFSADDPRLLTQCGVRGDGVLRTQGKAGLLMHGPCIAVAPGAYRVRLFGRQDANKGSPGVVQIVTQRGQRKHAESALPDASAPGRSAGLLSRLDFTIDQPVSDLEVQVALPEGADVAIESLDVVRLPDAP